MVERTYLKWEALHTGVYMQPFPVLFSWFTPSLARTLLRLPLVFLLLFLQRWGVAARLLLLLHLVDHGSGGGGWCCWLMVPDGRPDVIINGSDCSFKFY